MNPKELAAEAAITLAQELEKHGIVTFHVQNVVNLSQPIIKTAIEKAVKDTAELAQWHDKARRRVEQQRDDELKANRKYRAYITQLKQQPRG